MSDRRMSHLQKLTAALSRASTAEHVVEAVATYALEPAGACAGFVALLDAEGYLAITRALGPDEAQLASCRFPSSAQLPAADAVRERAPILLESPEAKAERYASWTAGRWSGYGAWAALPLLSDAEPLGAILLCFREARTFGEGERDFMQTVASVCAHALDRARLYDREQRARVELEVANARLADADRRKDEFLAMLGHELRNPLAPMVLALDIARRRGGAIHEEQRIIERQVVSLVRLVDDLLDVSRITRGKIELAREPMEIATAIEKAIELVKPLVERKSQRLEVSVPSHGLRVDGDAFRLAQALSNLLTNATRYTQTGGAVCVSAKREGADVVVTTRDDGIGIPPALLTEIFGLFVQGPTASRQQGLGIGLTLAQRLVELHGGSLTAASGGPGQGSEFVVRLPALVDEEPAATSGPSTPPADTVADAPRTSGAARPLRVLVVDDNADAATLLVDAFTSAGHDVVAAGDASEALRAVEGFVPDVAVLDIGLPDVDGYGLASRLRAQPRFAALRLVAVTGYGQPHDRERSAKAGFDAHFVKPVRVAELLAHLERS